MAAAVALVGGIVGGVASAVGAVIGTVASAVSGLVAGLAATINPILSGVVSAISGPLSAITSPLTTTITNILTPLSQGIAGLKGQIDTATSPILTPIKNAWETIHNYIESVKETVKPILEPIEDVMDVVNTYRDIKILGQILTGSEGIGRLVDYVKEGKLLDFGRAVADLYNVVSATTVGILERQNAERESFDEKLRYIDTSMRALIEDTQSKTLAKVYERITGVTGKLLGDIADLDLKLGRATQRIEDLEWFRTMMLRAVEE